MMKNGTKNLWHNSALSPGAKHFSGVHSWLQWMQSHPLGHSMVTVAPWLLMVNWCQGCLLLQGPKVLTATRKTNSVTTAPSTSPSLRGRATTELPVRQVPWSPAHTLKAFANEVSSGSSHRTFAGIQASYNIPSSACPLPSSPTICQCNSGISTSLITDHYFPRLLKATPEVSLHHPPGALKGVKSPVLKECPLQVNEPLLTPFYVPTPWSNAPEIQSNWVLLALLSKCEFLKLLLGMISSLVRACNPSWAMLVLLLLTGLGGKG